jgi:hypothetical protein
MIDVLQFYQTSISPLLRYAILLLAILILWIGLRRAGLATKARTTGLVATGVLLAWWALSDLLGRSGVYTEHWGAMRPVGWLIAILFLFPLMRSQAIGAALDALPLWWLPLLQLYRASGGLVWFAQVAAGRVPPAFGLVVGMGDLLTGIFAIVTAIWLLAGIRGGRIAAIAWNIFGLADFATAFVIGSLLPYNISYPSVMIPAFMAPLSVNFHALSLRQLLRANRRTSRLPGLAEAKVA